MLRRHARTTRGGLPDVGLLVPFHQEGISPSLRSVSRVDRSGTDRLREEPVPRKRETLMSQQRQKPPSPNDHEPWWRVLIAAIAQGVSREALVIILKEVWRQGPWP